jgi:hypothetical protein
VLASLGLRRGPATTEQGPGQSARGDQERLRLDPPPEAKARSIMALLSQQTAQADSRRRGHALPSRAVPQLKVDSQPNACDKYAIIVRIEQPLLDAGAADLIYAMSLLDRSVIGVLLDSIKADMHVSDTIMGIVTGLGFAVLYGIAGIPLAQWADHANRRNIISGGLVVFSLATALSGFAQNIWHLLTGRLLLALSEACSCRRPCRYSRTCSASARAHA